MSKPTPADLEYLEANTRFTRREIEQLYSDAGGQTLSRQGFDSMLDELTTFQGKDGAKIRDRFFEVTDKDNNDNVSMREVIIMLSTLQRGTIDQVAQLFFDIFDLNSNKKLHGEEIIEVYSQLLSSTTATDMTPAQKTKVREIIKKADKDGDGQLNFDEFLAAIKADHSAAKRPLTLAVIAENIFLVVVTSLFEMGTSFSLPAMGALSLGIQQRYDVGTSEVATASGVYFGGALIGPLLFGILMDRINSPIAIVTYANIIVAVGAALQAFAPKLWVLFIARVFLGFAGESTPFGTVESLQRLFPDQFLLMAGVRNLVQSSSTFLSFVLLPRVAGDTIEGTKRALWLCFGLAMLSLVANLVVWFFMRSSGRGIAKPEGLSIAASMRQYAKAITPKPPTKLAQLRLPLSLIPAMLAIQAFYYPPFSFTAFTNVLFPERFGTSDAEANFLSGTMSLIGGWLGPIFGPLSDYLGMRSVTMSFFLLPSVAAFILYAVSSSITPWVGIVLLGITYGWGDTVSYSSIRLLVGAERAGLGYGLFGLVGNIFGLAVPIIGGFIFEAENGLVNINWYFAALCGFGSVCWFAVRMLEGPKSAMELPAAQLIETEDATVNQVAMYGLLGAGKARKPDAEGQV